jgi:nitric oxide dioxygenase
MTEEQKGLVKNSWKIFRSIDPLLVGDVFYSKLFAQRPELRSMFPDSMEKQYFKLTDMLGIIVARLDRLDSLAEDILELAKRHAGYGVKTEHYKLVGDALIWTLQQGFGKDWTTELKDAWVNCYGVLADLMIKGSEPGLSVDR